MVRTVGNKNITQLELRFSDFTFRIILPYRLIGIQQLSILTITFI